jgi:hypothetical protein
MTEHAPAGSEEGAEDDQETRAKSVMGVLSEKVKGLGWKRLRNQRKTCFGTEINHTVSSIDHTEIDHAVSS